ncbi:MAG: four helix bundle protein [Ginsengibacter sp.]
MQLSFEMADKIHLLIKNFPKDELFILTQQIKRATDSICLNIAEGSTGQSNDEFKRFLGYSIRSGIEVVGCLYLAKRRSYINEMEFQDVYDFLNLLIKSIQALRNSIT